MFRPWLRSLLTEVLDGKTLRQTHEQRPNNWGTHAGAARAAIAAYLGDTAEMARTAQVFRGWLGDRTAYAGFIYGDLSWQCDAAKPVGINPTGCGRSSWTSTAPSPMTCAAVVASCGRPPAPGMPGRPCRAPSRRPTSCRVAGYDSWNWSDRAVLRATNFLYGLGGQWLPTGDNAWMPWVLNRGYATSLAQASPIPMGEGMGWTDWMFGPSNSAGTDADTHAHADPDTDADRHASPDPDRRSDTDAGRDPDAGPDAGRVDPDTTDPERERRRHGDPVSDPDTPGRRRRRRRPGSHPVAQPFADTDAVAHTDAESPRRHRRPARRRRPRRARPPARRPHRRRRRRRPAASRS